MDGKKARKARKPNFSAAECNLLLQLAEENLGTIREKFSNNLTNKKKQTIWQSICYKVNALGVGNRTLTQVREKWRAMCGEARKELNQEKKSNEKTGGGKPPPPPKATSQRIIELFGDEPGFSEIEGSIKSGGCHVQVAQQNICFYYKWRTFELLFVSLEHVSRLTFGKSIIFIHRLFI